jgi:tetratricopeptide (TPR) repeat protein
MGDAITIIFLILSGLIGAIRIIAKEWNWLGSKTSKLPYFNAITTSLFGVLLLVGIYFPVKAQIDKTMYSVFVSPKTISVSPSYNKKSLLKIVNNKDYPLYQIDLKIAVEEGDLSVDAVKLNPKDKMKLESDIGGVTLGHDVFGIGVITEDGIREDHKIIYELDAHSTKEFFVEIDATNLKKKSKVVFKIVRTDKEQADIISFDPYLMCQADDKDFKTYHEISKTMLDQRRYKEALVCCEKAILKNPKSAPTYNNMGIALLFLNEIDQAINKFREAIKLDPKLSKPYLNLAGVLIKNQKFEDAIKNLKVVSKIEGSEQPDAFVLWGQCLAINKDINGAVEKYKTAVTIDPACGPAYYYWGLLLKNNGDCEQAISKFKRSTEIEHEFKLDSYGIWGSCLENSGNHQEALNLYQTIIDKSPDSPQAQRSKNSIESLKAKMKEGKTKK